MKKPNQNKTKSHVEPKRDEERTVENNNRRIYLQSIESVSYDKDFPCDNLTIV